MGLRQVLCYIDNHDYKLDIMCTFIPQGPVFWGESIKWK